MSSPAHAIADPAGAPVSAAPTPAATAPIRVPAGTTAQDALKAAGIPLKGPDGAVVVRDLATGDLRDLAWAPEVDAEVEPVPAASHEGRAVIRHSTAHVLAQAVQDLFPGPPPPAGLGPAPQWTALSRGPRAGLGPAGGKRFLLHLPPRATLHTRGPQGPRKADAGDRQARPVLLRREISDADAQAELAHEP